MTLRQADSTGWPARVGVPYLLVQGFGALAWWATLFIRPSTRRYFLAPGAPDETLLAFFAPDFVLYAGASLAAAWGLSRGRPWAWPVLCAHAGAGAYAALYCLNLAVLSGAAWAGAVLMAPSLVVPPWLAWRLRPAGTAR